MRYRGGAVGHKTTYEETKCLLDDRDALDKIPFELESEHDWEDRHRSESSDVEMGSGDDGDEMEEDGSDEEEASGEGTDRDEEGEDEESDREEVSEGDGSDGDDGNEKDDDNMPIDVTASALLVDDDLLDEMDEFGYSGLDQVVEDEEEPHGYL